MEVLKIDNFINMDEVIKSNDRTTEELKKLMAAINAKLEQQAIYYDQKIMTMSINLANVESKLTATKEKLADAEKRLEGQLKINSNLQTQLEKIKAEFAETKEKIILSKDNQNTAGRPSLNDEEIRLIRQLLNEGLSMRKVSEMIDISLGSVHKYSQEQKRHSNVYGNYEAK